MVKALFAGLMLSFGALLSNGVSAGSYEPLEKRGCCSHHGGVCGCESDRAKCCDGQLSPSCGC